MSNLASRLAASKSASSTILAKDRTLSCDTRQTGLNNNALVIGPSGAGKTQKRPQAQPAANERKSYIVPRHQRHALSRSGTRAGSPRLPVQCQTSPTSTPSRPLRPASSAAATTPEAHSPQGGRQAQPAGHPLGGKGHLPHRGQQPAFWDHAAANLLSCLIAYVTEQLPADEQTISSVIKLIEHLQDGATARLFDDLITTDPPKLCPLAMAALRHYANAERMHASIVGILAEKVMCLGFDWCGTALS